MFDYIIIYDITEILLKVALNTITLTQYTKYDLPSGVTLLLQAELQSASESKLF